MYIYFKYPTAVFVGLIILIKNKSKTCSMQKTKKKLDFGFCLEIDSYFKN